MIGDQTIRSLVENNVFDVGPINTLDKRRSSGDEIRLAGVP